MVHQILTVATIVYLTHDKTMFKSQVNQIVEIGSEFLLLLTSVLIMQYIREDYDEAVVLEI